MLKTILTSLMLCSGSGLDKTEGYKEDTSDKVCTQYSGADCDKYWQPCQQRASEVPPI